MRPIVFAGNAIDRQPELRTQPGALEHLLTQGGTTFLPIWRRKCLVRGDRAALLPPEQIESRLRDPERLTLLGAIGGNSVFCVAIDDADEPSFDPGSEFVGLRDLPDRMGPDEISLVAYATAMVAWQKRHRHCGICGTRNRLREAGFVMECGSETCGHRSFPRLDPAIIVLVRRGGQCLLGRQPGWPPDRFSTIAGFVEPGESLEDAVCREVHEETNVAVENCRYLGSQPWPFPAAMMIGFHADAVTTEISCNDGELAEARWVSRREIVDRKVILPPAISIAYRLIESWFDEEGGQTLTGLDLAGPPLGVPRPLEQA